MTVTPTMTKHLTTCSQFVCSKEINIVLKRKANYVLIIVLYAWENLDLNLPLFYTNNFNNHAISIIVSSKGCDCHSNVSAALGYCL